MFVLQAPYDGIQTTTILPSPEWNDGEGVSDKMLLHQAMDGTNYTSIKTNNRNRFNYTFVVSRMKSAEVEAFINEYNEQWWRIINHKGETWKVVLSTYPVEFQNAGRDEYRQFSLDFEGIRVD